MRAQRKTGFAVVGLGSIAQSSVLPAFAHCKRARLVALVSRDKGKAKRLAGNFNVPAYYTATDYAECLANPEVAAVYIATPQGEHEYFTVQAARAGKHVLCEKPLAATLEQSERIVQACRENRVLLMTAYRKYFEPSAIYLKNLIRSGKLGRIDIIHTGFSELFNLDRSPNWLVNRKLAGGGPLMDLGIYCVNTTRWLLDEDPVEAIAQSWCHNRKRFPEVEEGVSFRLLFPSGTVMLGSSTYAAAPTSFIRTQGTKGWASLSPAYDFAEERRFTGKVAGQWMERTFAVLDEFAPELDAFASAIQGCGVTFPDGEQGHRDMIILHSIYEAAKRGATVKVKY
jgi:predicted dehydrogenase